MTVYFSFVATEPRGRYRPEVKDLIERILNARPEDEPALRQDIDRIFGVIGDATGAGALHGALTDAITFGTDLSARRGLLDWIGPYARGNPADVGALRAAIAQAVIEGASPLRSQSGEPIPIPIPLRPGTANSSTIDLPEDRPDVSQDRYEAARTVADALKKAIADGDERMAQLIFDEIQRVGWLRDRYPSIISDLDPPKPLNDLLDAADEAEGEPRPGYHIHHIAEQGSPLPPGSDRGSEAIEDPSNKVLIPEYKHIEISKFYSTKNEDYGGLSPREWLKDKTFLERYEFGLKIMRRFGVLE